tara:strand:- start:5277 stop:5450 length:174 start_codon:yes stop_codon:yes gene_type:complete
VTAEELKQFALLKIRMQRENTDKPRVKRLTRKQIEQKARKAVNMGMVNEDGHIVTPE